MLGGIWSPLCSLNGRVGAADAPFRSTANVPKALSMLCDLPPLRCCSADERDHTAKGSKAINMCFEGLRAFPLAHSSSF